MGILKALNLKPDKVGIAMHLGILGWNLGQSYRQAKQDIANDNQKKVNELTVKLDEQNQVISELAAKLAKHANQ